MKSLTNWFTDDDWNTLQNGDVVIETIRLENNNITSVPVLKAMPVKNLYLGSNLIGKIEMGAFQNLPNLNSLDLSHNKLTSKTFSRDIFSGNYSTTGYLPLPKMQRLNIGYNDLHQLDSDIFDHLTNLEDLILSGNEFQVINTLSNIAISSKKLLKVYF